MARLPEYQQTGRISPDLPRLNFDSLRESVRASQSLTSSLDRLSNFALQAAETDTETKAKQFSIDNKLTLEQVQEAAKSGIKPEDLIAASGGGAVWQNTLTKMQGEQLRVQLEVLGKQELMDLQTKVDIGEITNMTEVQAKQEAIVNGLRKTLSFAPDSVSRFDTSMGVVASANYKSNQDKLTKRYVAKQQLIAQQDQRNTVKIFKTQLENGDIKDFKTLSTLLDANEQHVFLTASDSDPAFALQLAKETREILDEAVINHFVDFAIRDDFSKNPNTNERDENLAMAKIINGDFGNESEVFNNLNEKDKALIRSSYLTRERDKVAIQKQVEEKQTLKDIEDVNNIQQDYFNSNKQDKQALKKLEAIVRRNPKALTAEALERIKRGNADDNAKSQFSNAAIALKERLRANPNMSWEQVTIEGQNLGLGQDIINQYIYPVFRSDTEKNYFFELNKGAESPAGSLPTFLKSQTLINDNDAVNKLISNAIEKNKNLPEGQKPTPVPNKIEALEIVRNKQAASPATANINTTISETNAYLKARTIKNITIDKNSSVKDITLTSQIDRVDSKGKFILPETDRKYLKTQLQIIDNARANK